MDPGGTKTETTKERAALRLLITYIRKYANKLNFVACEPMLNFLQGHNPEPAKCLTILYFLASEEPYDI